MSKLREKWSKFSSKMPWKWVLLGVAAVALVGFFGLRYWKGKKTAVPEGIAWGNGRIEGKEVDVASKLALKVKEVVVVEGELVEPGQVLVLMDTVTLEAELAEGNENVAAAREQLAVAQAAIQRRQSEIELAGIEKARSKKLLEERAGSQREYDVRNMRLKTTQAGLAEEEAKLEVARQQVKVAEANVQTIQTRIVDATLRSPISGRVLYRLAEPGEVLAAGGKALTLVDMEDVYMEIFLPAEQAAAVKIGAEARFKIDHQPDRVGVGVVSFVSPEAQFTPKEVETKTEREKLMFRVKIQIPKPLLRQYVDRVKTGVRGVGYVRLDESVAWPPWLDTNVVRPETLEQASR